MECYKSLGMTNQRTDGQGDRFANKQTNRHINTLTWPGLRARAEWKLWYCCFFSLKGVLAYELANSFFGGERSLISGLAVNLVSLCEAVCQEDETHELDVWLVLYCSEFHWSFHLAFLTFPVPMVYIYYHITLCCFMALLEKARFWQDFFSSLVRTVYGD